MKTEQIYSLLNSVNQQSEGKIDITVTDTSSFVALGDTILSSSANTEPFLNSLCQLIYTDIVEGRAYESPLRSLVKGSIEWGAIVRKLSVDMPEVSEEEALELENDKSIDMYKVKLPVAHQYLFVKRTPYKAWVTIQRTWLEEAFQSEPAMERFISTIFQKIQNRLELCIESLTKMSIVNYIGIAKEKQVMNLVTMYNAETTKEVPTGISALHDADFVRWAVGVIKQLMSDITSMSTLYNYEGEERFTPYAKQHLMLLSRFKTQLETVALYGAFNEDYLKLSKKELIPHWQGSGTELLKFDKQSSINVNVSIPGEEGNHQVTMTNVVAVLFDDEALGAYRRVKKVATTPLNASGLYTNTFFHEQQLWFNALDENFIVFTLN